MSGGACKIIYDVKKDFAIEMSKLLNQMILKLTPAITEEVFAMMSEAVKERSNTDT